MTSPQRDQVALSRTTVSVIVVTYNAPEWIPRSIESILDADFSTRAAVELIVVDNASDEETQRILNRYETRANVIRLTSNVGFGKACNIGAAAASGEFVLLLNPDTESGPRVVDALLEHYEEHPMAGIVGGRTLTEDGSLDPRSCWGRPTLWSSLTGALGLSAVLPRNRFLDPESLGKWDRSTSREVDIVTGCLLFTSREVWRRLGGFDETFFMYGEDADLCLRAKAIGYSPRITPEATIIHAVGASSTATLNKQRLLYRGKCSILRKHLPRWQSPIARRLAEIGVWTRMTGSRFGNPQKAEVYSALWRERRGWRNGWT